MSDSASAVYLHDAHYDVLVGSATLRYEIINSTLFCGSSGFDGALEFARPVYAASAVAESAVEIASGTATATNTAHTRRLMRVLCNTRKGSCGRFMDVKGLTWAVLVKFPVRMCNLWCWKVFRGLCEAAAP